MIFNLLNKYKLYLMIIILLGIIFIQRSCNNTINKPKVITITVPEVKGKFDTIKKPKEIKSELVQKYKTVKDGTIVIPAKIDTSLIKNFEKSNDSIKLNKFIDAIKIRQYNEQFEDDNIKLSIFTETSGELIKISPTYIIKEKTILVKNKETIFALYAGGKISNNLKLNNINLEANIGIQNKKGDIIYGGYDTQGNISLGYSFRLINIKK